ncbi:MAG: lamin tail domain-containing protein [Bacteroidota bacterium]
MKFLYVVFLLILCIHLSSQILITEVVDGTKTLSYPRYVELTNAGSSSFNLQNYKLKIYMNGTATVFTYTFSSYILPANQSVVITNIDNVSADQMWSDYTLVQPTYVIHGETNTIKGNGNDAYELLDAGNAVIDVYGIQDQDGTGQVWEYTDSYAYRNLNINSPNSTFTLSEWTIAPPNTLDGMGDDLSPFLTPGYRALSAENDILTFTFPEQTGSAIINSTNHTVNIEVTAVANLANLTPTITISPSATINPLSGESNDFSIFPFVFTVTAQDGTPQDWNIYVTQASGANNETDILSFSLTQQTGPAIINNTNHTVDIEVLFGTNVAALSPTITVSVGASINPLSGSVQDFTNPFIYTVTAEDAINIQDWTVTVTTANSSANDIITFVLSQQTGPATINSTNHTVNIEVANGTNLNSLTPTITVSPGATINPFSGTPQNFSTQFTYTVTAQDATTQDWTVNVSEAAPLNNETDILSFTFVEQTVPADINSGTHTVDIEVVNGTNVAALTPSSVTLSQGATIFPTSITQQDFTSPVTYTVTAENGTDFQLWTVTVTEAILPSNNAEILSFVIAEQTGQAIIDSALATVEIEVTNGTNVANLAPNITVSAGASVSPLSGSVQDFTFPVTYTVTAQDATTKDWLVSVSVASGNILVNNSNNYIVFPNPVKEIINIECNKTISYISVYTISGQLLITENQNSNKAELDLGNLSNGLYMLKFSDNDGNRYVSRFIKE